MAFYRYSNKVAFPLSKLNKSPTTNLSVTEEDQGSSTVLLSKAVRSKLKIERQQPHLSVNYLRRLASPFIFNFYLMNPLCCKNIKDNSTFIIFALKIKVQTQLYIIYSTC